MHVEANDSEDEGVEVDELGLLSKDAESVDDDQVESVHHHDPKCRHVLLYYVVQRLRLCIDEAQTEEFISKTRTRFQELDKRLVNWVY